MTFKKTREAQDKKRAFILNIINKSERGKYKNICSGEAHCKNKTIYKYHLYIQKMYIYFCSSCINLKNTELPI
tara:strand:- start:1192 stop:1410 length:219 start_codon:yes stop_codon:yes gene_type:complete